MSETVSGLPVTEKKMEKAIEVCLRQCGSQNCSHSTQAQAMGTLRKVPAAHLYKVSKFLQTPFPFSFSALTSVLMPYA